MITATQHVKKMRGGAQSHLMLGSDGCAYVIKFQNNPQHLRVLANEFIATNLAQMIGLKVPEVEVVDVSQWLVSSTTELVVTDTNGSRPCKAGYQFGSRFVGGLLPGHCWDYLPTDQLSEVTNKCEFAGMLIVDKWTCNSDSRQAVFHKKLRQKRYTATFVDQGNCFDEGKWSFSDGPYRGAYARNEVYEDITGWDSFEPWLSRTENMDPQTAWQIARNVPEEWLGGPPIELAVLLERLFARRSYVRELITQFRESARNPFPNWHAAKQVAVAGAQVLCWKPSVGAP